MPPKCAGGLLDVEVDPADHPVEDQNPTTLIDDARITDIPEQAQEIQPEPAVSPPPCHFQKPTALADPRIRLAWARMQSGFDPAPVRKWAALSSFWIRTRLHQGSDRPKPVTDSASCRTSCGLGESGDSVPGTVT